MRAASRVAVRAASSKYAGTVITALVTGLPVAFSDSVFKCFKISAEISTGVRDFPPALIFAMALVLVASNENALLPLNARASCSPRPIKRLIDFTTPILPEAKSAAAILPTT